MKLKPYHIRIWLSLAAVVAAVLLFGNPNPQPEPASQTLEGWLGAVYGDSQAFDSAYTALTLMDNAGNLTPLQADSVPHNLVGDYVRVAVTGADTSTLMVSDIAPVNPQDVAFAGVTGNEKWVNIACRFSDVNTTPQPVAYFENIMTDAAPGMNHYWQQTSSGLVNITGSAAYGWYDLPQAKDYYLRLVNASTGIGLQTLLNHCLNAALAQTQLDLNAFSGINIMLNDTFGCCAWGGKMPIVIDGTQKTFRTTWLPPWAFNSLHVIAHEMGHGWGLPHSSGPYGLVYDSAWDVMSGGSRMVDECRIGYRDFGCQQVGTIGYHLHLLGWIPNERVVTVQKGQELILTLDALTTTQAGYDKLLVKIPTNTAGTIFYTAEVRVFTGYDRNLPGEAVILHEVVTGRSSPAHVVDGDNNGDPNDEGAMWTVGETFTKNAVTIEVLSRLGTTFTIRVKNG